MNPKSTDCDADALTGTLNPIGEIFIRFDNMEKSNFNSTGYTVLQNRKKITSHCNKGLEHTYRKELQLACGSRILANFSILVEFVIA